MQTTEHLIKREVYGAEIPEHRVCCCYICDRKIDITEDEIELHVALSGQVAIAHTRCFRGEKGIMP